MKITELQIGNWVSYCNEPFQVDYLHRIIDTIGLKYRGKNHNFQDGAVCAEDLSPIPLTPEILENNGFYDRNQWYHKRVWANGCFDIAVALDYREIEILKVCGSGTDCEEVDYGSTIAFGSDINVHELQQALHLCGLTDFADNFKIE